MKDILEAQQNVTESGEYIAVFSDGTVSDVLTSGTVPNPEEGDYVRIFKTDSKADIEAKIGSLQKS